MKDTRIVIRCSTDTKKELRKLMVELNARNYEEVIKFLLRQYNKRVSFR